MKLVNDVVTVDVYSGDNAAYRDFEFRDDIKSLPPIPRTIATLILDAPEKTGIEGCDSRNQILGKLRSYLMANGVVKNVTEYHTYMHYLRKFLKSLNA